VRVNNLQPESHLHHTHARAVVREKLRLHLLHHIVEHLAWTRRKVVRAGVRAKENEALILAKPHGNDTHGRRGDEKLKNR
jgi:hypothetical protein